MNALKTRRINSGFTLVELMITVVIIAIIAAIALPAYNDYIKRSQTRIASANLVSYAAAVENTFQRTLSYPSSGEEITGWTDPKDNFDYNYDPSGSNGYTVTATGKGAMAGCTLTLTDKNDRGPSPLNSACGMDEW